MATSRQIQIVRFNLGDPAGPFQEVSDDDIALVVEGQPILTLASAILADSIAARYASEVDTTIGPTSVSKSQRFAQWSALAKRLRETPPGDFAGERDTIEYPTPESVREPAFRVGMDDRDRHDGGWLRTHDD
jgi:hypothetical protein